MNKLQVFTKGILKENPTLILLLGCCPFLATTTSGINGLGMGGCTTAVLFFSNILISILKKAIPDNVRIPCYIVVIASLVTVVQMMMQAFLPDLNASLGLYIPLIVVNCIILGRAEGFANHNTVIDSALDGLGMGIGFTLACFVMGCIREVLGAGTILGIALGGMTAHPMIFFMLPAGGFFVFGVLNALVTKITTAKNIPKVNEFSCSGCLMAESCAAANVGSLENDMKKAIADNKVEANKIETKADDQPKASKVVAGDAAKNEEVKAAAAAKAEGKESED
ncbi:MAG: electron transport complex subunit RsxE [Anaerovoracaceae bacterium]|jgi:electron transport complex protein RnfE